MRQNLPITYQRVIAAGLLIALLASLYILVISPYLSLGNTYDSRLTSLNKHLLHNQRLLLSQDELQRQVDALLEDIYSGGRFISAGTEALASAELQKHIKSIVTANHGNLSSMQVVKTQNENGLATVTVRVRLSCMIADMLAILHALEANRPVVTLDALSFLTRGRGTRRKHQQTLEYIDISFDATGYTLDLKT